MAKVWAEKANKPKTNKSTKTQAAESKNEKQAVYTYCNCIIA